eukprot:5150046-Amphidinium_carterae.1
MTKFLDADTMCKHVKKLGLNFTEGPKRVNPPCWRSLASRKDASEPNRTSDKRGRESRLHVGVLSLVEGARCNTRDSVPRGTELPCRP